MVLISCNVKMEDLLSIVSEIVKQFMVWEVVEIMIRWFTRRCMVFGEVRRVDMGLREGYSVLWKRCGGIYVWVWWGVG